MAPLRVAGRTVIGIGDSHVQMRDDEDVTVVLLGVLFFFLGVPMFTVSMLSSLLCGMLCVIVSGSFFGVRECKFKKFPGEVFCRLYL